MDEKLKTDLVIKGRKRDLGGFTVNRVIPSSQRRHVGPFVFLDHLGPMKIDETHVLDVRPHPHIGLSTVTYLFEGNGYHRDSLGSEQKIIPGDLNWMTAGKGIVHSERTPKEDRDPKLGNLVHGIQIWVGLPLKDEDCDPGFSHYPHSSLPALKMEAGLSGKLLIGSYESISSPVKTFSRTFFADLKADGPVETILNFNEAEIGIFLISGEATINGQELQLDDLILVTDPKKVSISVSAGTRLIVIGGEPFPESRIIWWNFVSSSKEKIHRAAELWAEQKFGQVPGEVEFIPLPRDALP
jgi:redox-sensitive bicupin YhaK (pirin superfamily)